MDPGGDCQAGYGARVSGGPRGRRPLGDRPGPAARGGPLPRPRPAPASRPRRSPRPAPAALLPALPRVSRRHAGRCPASPGRGQAGSPPARAAPGAPAGPALPGPSGAGVRRWPARPRPLRLPLLSAPRPPTAPRSLCTPTFLRHPLFRLIPSPHLPVEPSSQPTRTSSLLPPRLSSRPSCTSPPAPVPLSAARIRVEGMLFGAALSCGDSGPRHPQRGAGPAPGLSPPPPRLPLGTRSGQEAGERPALRQHRCAGGTGSCDLHRLGSRFTCAGEKAGSECAGEAGQPGFGPRLWPFWWWSVSTGLLPPPRGPAGRHRAAPGLRLPGAGCSHAAAGPTRQAPAAPGQPVSGHKGQSSSCWLVPHPNSQGFRLPAWGRPPLEEDPSQM